MLREYVNGKYKDDASISTTLVSLLRKVDKHFVELGIPLKEEAYKNEYSYGKAYDLLTKLNNDVVVNPLLWSEQANLPTEENASANTLTKQKFYNYMDQELANETPNEILQNTIANEIYNEDPLQHLRQDMRETLYIVLMIQRPMKLMMVFLYMKINKIILFLFMLLNPVHILNLIQ